MAQIIEEVIVIKLSRIIKDSDKQTAMASNQELLTTLETVAQELVGPSVVVEATVA
jgi:hypothetical protein